jgi:hypothetical protein
MNSRRLYSIRSVQESRSGVGQTEKNSVRAYVFRFALELGRCSTQSACLKGAKETHAPQQMASLFDYLVGAGKQGRRDGEAERLAFTRCGIDNLAEFVQIYKANPNLLPRPPE